MGRCWDDREADFRGLVLDEGLTDRELAGWYGVSTTTIRKVRDGFGLPMNPGRKIPNFVPPPPTPTPFTTYLDGPLLIKRYPPAYALGAVTQCTARPRR